MKKIFSSFFLTNLLLFSTFYTFSQPSHSSEKPKKLGLVLSGGGAKGLAHLGLLKLIDSLDIKVDYITGTSMGGVLSGLYASGYSVAEIKKIIMDIAWDRVLSNKVPLNKINIEEKDEYDNYIIEFPVSKGKPQLPSSLIEGQYISEVFNTLTFPSRHIYDFHSLPIPLEISSSDILNGGLVMQRNGSLPLAMRTTMAIPAAFAPMIIDGKLLVDGGLDRNYPVEEVKRMGADMVIGGYTGFRLLTSKEIENPMKLIYQTYAVNGVIDAQKQMKKADMTVDFTKPLFDYSTSDFGAYKKIIEIGEKEALKYLDELKKIKQYQIENGIVNNRKKVTDNQAITKKINISYEDGSPIENPAEEAMIRSLLGMKENQYYSVEEVNKGIERVFGTRYYNKVFYTYSAKDADNLTLNIFIKKNHKVGFKMGIHYDNEQSAGILLNYTFRNMIGNKSRLVATIDLAERLKGRLNYYKFLDRKNRFWLMPALEYNNQKSNDIYIKSISNAITFSENEYFRTLFKVSLGGGYTINQSSKIEMGWEYNHENYKRKTGSLLSLFVDEFQTDKYLYKHQNNAEFIRYTFNNLNSQYFAKSGHRLILESKFYLNNKLRLAAADTLDRLGVEILNWLKPDSSILRNPHNSIRFFINEKFAIPLSAKTSIVGNAFAGLNYNFIDKLGKEIYLYPNQRFYVGGTQDRQNADNPNFIGLKRNEFPVNQLISLHAGVQFNPLSKVFITPIVGVLYSNYTSVGYGLDLGYLSFVGPIKLGINRSNIIPKTRFDFSFGYMF